MDRETCVYRWILILAKMEKNTLYILFFMLPVLCCGQVFSPQSKKMTEAYFPEMNVEITTPAFQKKRGYTDYEELVAFLEGLKSKHADVMTIFYIGKSQKGRDIPYVHLHKRTGRSDKIKVWLQGGMHGNEPASTEGVLYILQQLLENPEYSHMLDELEIGIVPMANIDGFLVGERNTANGLDPNRDQTKLMIPESIYLKQAFSDFNAEVALDFHEFRPFRLDYLRMGAKGFTVPHDVMFLYSGNLNVPRSLRDMTQNIFVKNAAERLKTEGLTAHDYFTSSDDLGHTVINVGSMNPRASATSYALSNCVSSIVEVRGVGLGKTSFRRRVMTTFLIGMDFMQTAVAHKNELRQVLLTSLSENKEVVVRSVSRRSEENLQFIDIATNKLTDEKVSMRNSLHARATRTRTIPTAYIIMPTELNVVDKLRILGLEVNKLRSAQDLSVENFVVAKYRREPVKYEGVFQQTVSTKLDKIQKSFPAGSFVVYTDQKNKGLLFEVIEPEAQNGFVSFGVLSTEEGQELPVYRYTGEKLQTDKK